MKYLEQLHLNREPFSTSPDPNFFYRSQNHQQILQRLEINIRLQRGLNLILGDIGTGKTTLSRALLHSFVGEEDDFIFHLILNPAFKTDEEFLSYLVRLFGIDAFFHTKLNFQEAIENYLFKKSVEEGKKVVLIIDEGQKLTDSQLEILRTLLNYETNESKLLQLVIFSQIELQPRILKMENFFDRIIYRGLLKPLSFVDMCELIRYRLRVAGYNLPQSLFTQEAMQRIYEYSNGYPRRVSRVCHLALEKILIDDREIVTLEVIQQIITDEQAWMEIS